MIFNHEIGVMQGRLLPKYQGRYQAHPVGYWEEEFFLANKFGLSCIEFILDFNLYLENPLMSSKGTDMILKCVHENDIYVKSVCADYFMHHTFHDIDLDIVKKCKNVMSTLIKNCKVLDVTDIVVPCVDSSAFKNNNDIKRFITNIQSSLDLAEQKNINISLETDLNPTLFSQLLSEIPSKRLTVNYDTGNSASLGYNVIEEFDSYGNRISDIHIKDRKLNGGSVELGKGDVDFNSFFKCLQKIDFKHPFIMQAYRDNEGLKVFERQLNFFQSQLLKFRN